MKALLIKFLNEGQIAVLKFFASILGLYLLWYLVYDLWLFPNQRFDDWLSVNVAWTASELLSLFGFIAFNQKATIYVFEQARVIITTPCNGMMLFGIFSGFIIAYPGLAKNKILFIPIGIAIIYSVNVLRVAALALNHIYNNESLEFNHHYTYTIIVYGFIFMLWRAWMIKWSHKKLSF